MDRIIIITYDMIPHSPSLGAAQRMLFLSNFLKQHQCDVYVVSACKPFYNYYDCSGWLVNLL